MNGRKILSGSWMQAILITVLLFLLSGGITLLETSVRKITNVPEIQGNGFEPNLSAASFVIMAVFSVVMFLFITPLQTGQTEWYWELSGGKKPTVGMVFGWYGSFRFYLKSLLLQIHVLWRLILWALLVFAAPGALFALYFLGLGGADTPVANLVFALGIVLFVCAAVLLWIISLRYFPACYLLVEDSRRRPNDCVRNAALCTKGFRFEIFKFQLSFIFWFLSCYLILPALYVMPYYYASSAVLARHIVFSGRAPKKIDGPSEPPESPRPPEPPKGPKVPEPSDPPQASKAPEVPELSELPEEEKPPEQSS